MHDQVSQFHYFAHRDDYNTEGSPPPPYSMCELTVGSDAVVLATIEKSDLVLLESCSTGPYAHSALLRRTNIWGVVVGQDMQREATFVDVDGQIGLSVGAGPSDWLLKLRRLDSEWFIISGVKLVEAGNRTRGRGILFPITPEGLLAQAEEYFENTQEHCPGAVRTSDEYFRERMYDPYANGCTDPRPMAPQPIPEPEPEGH